MGETEAEMRVLALEQTQATSLNSIFTRVQLRLMLEDTPRQKLRAIEAHNRRKPKTYIRMFGERSMPRIWEISGLINMLIACIAFVTVVESKPAGTLDNPKDGFWYNCACCTEKTTGFTPPDEVHEPVHKKGVCTGCQKIFRKENGISSRKTIPIPVGST